MMNKPDQKQPIRHKSPKKFSKDGGNDIVSLRKIVQALARQQAKQDHELMKKNETSSHIR